MNGFPLPLCLHNAEGKIRTLGVELEFAGLEVDEIDRIIIELYGGRLEPLSRFQHKVVDTQLGTFTVEIDLTLLKERSYLKFLDFMGVTLEPESLRQAEDMLARIAATLVPHEIASPPLPMTKVHQLEQLRVRLQAARHQSNALLRLRPAVQPGDSMPGCRHHSALPTSLSTTGGLAGAASAHCAGKALVVIYQRLSASVRPRCTRSQLRP